MGVMTGVQFYDLLRADLGNRTTTDIAAATAVHWFNWVIDHLSSPRVYRHRELEETTTQTMVASTRVYTIAAATGVGTVAVDSVVIFDPNNTQRKIRLQPLRSRDVHEMSQQMQPGEPNSYSWWGSTQIEVMPAPDAAHVWTLSIRRIKKPTLYTSGNLTSGSVLSPYDSQWDQVISTGARWHGWEFLREWERAEKCKREFGQLINEVASRASVESEDVDFGPPLQMMETM